jgi:hypothetical protein
MFLSDVVTHKFWYSRFMAGVHKQVGQIRRPDKELNINAIHAADKILETERQSATMAVQKKKIAEMGAWFIGGFCRGLSGEEMLLIELTGVANIMVHLNKEENAHFLFVILGCMKKNQNSGTKFAVPCTPVTQGTHL